MLTSVYDTHNNKNRNNNDKRVIGIAQLCLLAVLKVHNEVRKITEKCLFQRNFKIQKLITIYNIRIVM